MLLSEEIKCYFENHVDSQMSVLGHGGSIAGKTGPFFKIVIFDERNRDPYKKNFVYLTGVENAIYYATNPRYHDYNWPAEELRELRETFGPDIV
jgi:hypothetical protein